MEYLAHYRCSVKFGFYPFFSFLSFCFLQSKCLSFVSKYLDPMRMETLILSHFNFTTMV